MAVFAQVAPIDIAQMVTQFSSVGFAVWFAYYTVTKLVPDLVKDFRSDIKEQRESFLKHLDLLSSTFGSVADAAKDNVAATNKVDSHVVRLAARMDHTGKQIRDFARMWRHNIDSQRAIAKHLGIYEEVAGDMDRMEQLADRIIVDDLEEPKKVKA